MNVAEADEKFFIPYAFIKEGWDVAIVSIATREILWVSGLLGFLPN